MAIAVFSAFCSAASAADLTTVNEATFGGSASWYTTGKGTTLLDATAADVNERNGQADRHTQTVSWYGWLKDPCGRWRSGGYGLNHAGQVIATPTQVSFTMAPIAISSNCTGVLKPYTFQVSGVIVAPDASPYDNWPTVGAGVFDYFANLGLVTSGTNTSSAVIQWGTQQTVLTTGANDVSGVGIHVYSGAAAYVD